MKKIDDGWIADCKLPCRHPEHNPPGMIVLPSGTYEHTCPKCGKVQVVIIREKGSL